MRHTACLFWAFAGFLLGASDSALGETVSVSACGLDPGTTIQTYTGRVRLTVTGVVVNSPGSSLLDAFYGLQPDDTSKSVGACAACFRYNRASEGTCVCSYECGATSHPVADIIVGTYPAFTASHTYSLTLDLGSGPAEKLNFGVADCGCSDNSGTMSVTIESDAPTTTTLVPTTTTTLAPITTTTLSVPIGACCTYPGCITTSASACLLGSYQGDRTVCTPGLCSVCGNGQLEYGEQCDDGDTVSAFGAYCSSQCTVATCGVPTSTTRTTPAASDALFTLQTAVGQTTCDLRVCDVDHNQAVTASDALLILKAAVGLPVDLACAAGPTTTTTTLPPPKDCGNPGTPSNGTKTGTGYGEGATVTFACDSCYSLSGSASRICQADGTWSGIQPTCKILDCANPGTPSNGKKTGTTYTCGASVSYSCNDGYSLSGDAARTCQSNGLWSGTLPTCALSPLAAPDSLVANAVSSTQVDLNWKDNSNNETGFKIERRKNVSSYSQIAAVGANVQAYSDMTPAPATQYYYRVRATNAARDSANSNESGAFTPLTYCRGDLEWLFGTWEFSTRDGFVTYKDHYQLSSINSYYCTVYGEDLDSGDMVAAASASPKYLLLDPGSSICEAFSFSITGANMVAGEDRIYYRGLSGCTTSLLDVLPMTGQRTATLTSPCGTVTQDATLGLACTSGTITSIEFASYGTPAGTCGSFARGTCNATNTVGIVTNACVGRTSCTIQASDSVFGDPCFGTAKWLSVRAHCG